MEVPSPFVCHGMACGIKPSGGPDLAIIAAQQSVVAAGVYTQNLVRAACIDWNRTITPTTQLRGVVINSGNANACTGAQGVADNAEMAELTAASLSQQSNAKVRREQIAVLSTGVIGQKLPMDKLRAGIPKCHLAARPGPTGFDLASRAILTTDHGPKVGHRSWQCGGSQFRLAAMCKGAGMIGPNMATMLGIVLTDYPLTVEEADSSLREAVSRSFNRISVEGHTSTNDAVILLAREHASDSRHKNLPEFQSHLNSLCLELAKRIPTDGEGAKHLIHIRVEGAKSSSEAERMARTIALSNLVKTAVAGGDPNWGRIVSAAGYSGAHFDVDQTGLRLNGIEVFRDGQPTEFDRAAASLSIRNHPVAEIVLNVGDGPGSADHWTSDLTVDYVKLNAEYTT